MNGADLRRALGHYPTGVCVVTALEENGAAAGMAVGSFTSVSLDPPLVAFLPAKTSTTWPRIEAAGRFCINVLGTEQVDLCRRFSQSGGTKFDGVNFLLSSNGSPIIEGVVAWIDCGLYNSYEAGDHLIVLGEVLGIGVENAPAPLLFLKGRYGGFSALTDARQDGL